MQYMQLAPSQREALLASLNDMPIWLARAYAGLAPEQACHTLAEGDFSPVEQVWHLADLEREGFGLRIERLLTEAEPQLPDFDGGAIAVQRNYRALSLAEGLSAFVDARQRNLARLRALTPEAWARSGTQEGVGPVALCDMPGLMSRHDAAHRAEIEAWKRAVAAA